jgi:hypothetical protein
MATSGVLRIAILGYADTTRTAQKIVPTNSGIQSNTAPTPDPRSLPPNKYPSDTLYPPEWKALRVNMRALLTVRNE